MYTSEAVAMMGDELGWYGIIQTCLQINHGLYLSAPFDPDNVQSFGILW